MASREAYAAEDGKELGDRFNFSVTQRVFKVWCGNPMPLHIHLERSDNLRHLTPLASSHLK